MWRNGGSEKWNDLPKWYSIGIDRATRIQIHTHSLLSAVPTRPVLSSLCSIVIIVVFLAHSLSCLILCDPMDCRKPGSASFTISQSVFQFMFESVMPFNLLILCCPLLLLPSIFLSIRVFSNGSALSIWWPKYWSLSFRISPSNDYSGLISFMSDWLDFLAVQRTLNSSLAPQFKSIDALAFSLVYLPTFTFIHDFWEYHNFDYTDLCQQNNVGLFSTLSRFVIAVLWRSKSFNFMTAVTSTVILEPPEIKSVTASTFSLSICHEVIGPDAMILVLRVCFFMLSFKPAFCYPFALL